MAGLRGNDALFALQKQSARASAAALDADSDVTPFTGGNIGPARAIDQLSETDSSRDEGVSYVQQTSVAGNPEFYLRDSIAHHVLEAAMGTINTTGTTNYVHALTLASVIPYYTFYKEQSDTLYEKYADCMVNELTVSAEAGGPLTAGLDIVGRSATRLAAQPASLPDQAEDTVHNFNNATVTLAGVGTSLIGSFDLTLTNNVSTQQTDDSVPYDVVPGLRSATLGFDLIFETLDEYNKFHYGGASGTTVSSTIHTTSAEFLFSRGANNSVEFTFPSIAYEEFPVEPDAGGDPIVVPVRARAQRHASGLLSAEVKNQKAT